MQLFHLFLSVPTDVFAQQASAREYYSSTHIFRGTVGDPRTTEGGDAVWGAESTFTTVCSTQKGIQFVGPRLAATPLS